MEITVIKTEKEYEHALERFQEIFHAENTPESDVANLLALSIEDYESKHYVIPRVNSNH